MNRHNPDSHLNGIPCSVVAVSTALGEIPVGTIEYMRNLKADGYASLNVANRYIRDNLKVKRRKDYRRGERPKLKDLHLEGKAVVCVYGHLIYLDHEDYWSFFENEEDDVVALWEIE